MKKIIQLATVVLLVIINSCGMKEEINLLPGKIAITSNNHVCSIYDNADSVRFKFNVKSNEDVHYGGFTWLNGKDSFAGSEYIPGKAREEYKGNIALFDLNGKIIERIYESQMGEIADGAFSSKNDKYLLFTIQRVGDLNINPLEGLMRMNSIIIMDFEKKEVIRALENLGRSPNFNIHESPWIFDENRFIFSISNENKIVAQGKDMTSVENDSAGIYMYDLVTDQKKMIAPGGRFGIASPVAPEIAYIKDQSVWVMNLNDSSTKMIYKAGRKEKLSNIHWTPDGKCIYLVCFINYGFNLVSSDEKLIDVNTKKDLRFKKIKHGYYSYTWK